MRTEEQNPLKNAEVLDNSCLMDEKVLDPFAKTMKTGLAAISIQKACTLFEEAKDCFNFAKSRLEAFAR